MSDDVSGWASAAGAVWCGAEQMPVPPVSAGVLRGIAFGVPFEARVDDRRLLPAVRARLPPGSAPTRIAPAIVLSLVHEVSDTMRWRTVSSRRRGRGVGLTVRLDGQPVARGLGHEDALDVFESELQLSVARRAQPEVFVHAGVVAVGGRAIVVPGRSGTGKTTLVRALVDAGATYFSDEYAVIDGAGWVHPYARRLSVRVRRGGKERQPVPRNRGRRPVRVGLIVQTRYHPRARWQPTALSAGECVLALLSNTVPARDRPAEVLATLVRVSDGARGFRGDRGPAARTARALIALLLGTETDAGARDRTVGEPVKRRASPGGSRTGTTAAGVQAHPRRRGSVPKERCP